MNNQQERHYFSTELLAWYQRSKRDLPWRRSKNPYFIWVSEIMLQQTRVETVIPYFHRFITKFPTIEALASAPEEEVLKAWEGLGYYSRARNLQSAVREVHENYGGVVPDGKEDVSSLKGVGPYTAGAILSIAYNKPEPAVDGNVMRVLSRYFLLEDDIAKGSTRVRMERLAQELIPSGAAGDFNQALMELGATVCTPRSPHCLTCPVMEHCAARLQGMAETLPIKTKAKPPRPELRAVALVEGSGAQAGRLLIRQRPQDGLLARMWELPHAEISATAGLGEAGSRQGEPGEEGASAGAMSDCAASAEGAAGSTAATSSTVASLEAVWIDGGTDNASAVTSGADQGSRSQRSKRRRTSLASEPPAAHAQHMGSLQLHLAETDGVNVAPLEWLMHTDHTFSHIHWDMLVYRCRYIPAIGGGRSGLEALPPNYRWLDPDELERYAFPNVFLRIIEQYKRTSI